MEARAAVAGSFAELRKHDNSPAPSAAAGDWKQEESGREP